MPGPQAPTDPKYLDVNAFRGGCSFQYQAELECRHFNVVDLNFRSPAHPLFNIFATVR